MMVITKTYKLNYALILLLLMQWPNRKNIEAGPLNLQRSLSVDTLRHNNNNDGGRIMDIPFREGSEEILSPKCGLVVEGSRSDESCSYGSSRRSLPGSSYSISPSRELSDVTLNAWTGENTNRNEFSVFSPKLSLESSSTLINPSASTIPKCSSNGSRSVVVCAKASLVYMCVCVC